MNAVQLELNIDQWSEEDVKFKNMQIQIDAMNESMGKVRRKLFSQMGEMQKMCLAIKQENDILKERLNVVQNAKNEWTYGQGDCLFNVQEN